MEERVDEETEYQVDVRKILRLLLGKLPFIIVLTLVMGIAAFVYSNYFMTPIYRASVSFWIDNQQGVSDSAKVQGTDFSTSTMLAKGYVSLINSDMVLDEVAVISGLGYSPEQLASMISSGMVDEETPVFVVYVSNPNPEYAQRIANAIAEVAPAQIQNVIKGSSATVIDPAKLPQHPVSPNVKRNTLLGLIIGLVLSVVIVFLLEAFDVRIKSSDYLTQKYSLPVLGVIPKISSEALKSAKTDGSEVKKTGGAKAK